MGRLTPEMNGEDAIMVLSEGNPGAMTVLLDLFKAYGLEGLVMCMVLDEFGLYGPDIWNFYKRIHHEDLGATADAIRLGNIVRWEEPQASDIINMNYGDDEGFDAGKAVDDEFFKRNPYELYYFRKALPGELASGGYPDYDGLLVIVVVKEGVRVRVPCLDEDHGTKEALKYLELLGDE